MYDCKDDSLCVYDCIDDSLYRPGGLCAYVAEVLVCNLDVAKMLVCNFVTCSTYVTCKTMACRRERGWHADHALMHADHACRGGARPPSGGR